MHSNQNNWLNTTLNKQFNIELVKKLKIDWLLDQQQQCAFVYTLKLYNDFPDNITWGEIITVNIL